MSTLILLAFGLVAFLILVVATWFLGYAIGWLGGTAVEAVILAGRELKAVMRR